MMDDEGNEQQMTSDPRYAMKKTLTTNDKDTKSSRKYKPLCKISCKKNNVESLHDTMQF